LSHAIFDFPATLCSCPVTVHLDVMRDPINQTQSIASHRQHLKAYLCLKPLAAASDRFTSSSLLKSNSLDLKSEV